MLPLYLVATLTGAVLTFVLQPFVAKLILPLFGGAPAVWNTSVLFFQVVLLAGYGYAYLLTTNLGPRRGAALHLAVAILPLAVLPVEIGVEWAPTSATSPLAWQLWLLTATVGPPFFVATSTAPLLQRWFSITPHAAAADPYFLYAASNFGSLIGLFAYPLLLEPTASLPTIARGWVAGYVLLVALVAGCAAHANRNAVPASRADPASRRDSPSSNHAITATTRVRWLALAFVPSSLMLAVTTYLSTDIAAAPLLWVVPLALYLVSFVFAFARRRFAVAPLERVMPLFVILVAVSLLARGLEPPPWAMFVVHLGGLLLIATALHGQLADRRPPVEHLTEYYFWIAAGGAAGGAFNALVAPLLFTNPIEYPLILVAACLLRRPPRDAPAGALPATGRDLLRHDALPAAAVGMGAFALAAVANPATGADISPLAIGLALGVPALASYLLLMRPVRFALAIAALFVSGDLSPRAGDRLFAERTYYGVHTVRRIGEQHHLIHGKTLHGIQDTRPEAAAVPLAYYHGSGPAGGVFAAFRDAKAGPLEVGVVGLGVGSLAAYARAGDRWTFYELDPTVVYLARESGLFTYWRDAAAELEVVLGDARLSLAAREGPPFDLLVLDAFSSDSVPVHLLTREALRLYRGRLRPGGVIAVHISNRFLDLASVVGAVATDARLEAVVWEDTAITFAQRDEGKLPSQWVVVTDNEEFLRRLAVTAPWRPIDSDVAPWTDAFSNIASALRWSGASQVLRRVELEGRIDAIEPAGVNNFTEISDFSGGAAIAAR